ncbi:MAG: DciA family protein [Gammaproteobacteria bacterium]|nr:DciA family protein [Gammaproteobacteria bacterium]
MKTFIEQINPNFIIQAKKLGRLTKLVHSILPVECHGHVTVGGIRDQNLMLITDSPVWTTRLRQLSPQILQHISSNMTGMGDTQTIHHVQINTRYHASAVEKQQLQTGKHRHRPQISEKSALMLSQSANSITHQKLKTALLKLASHSKAKPSEK